MDHSSACGNNRGDCLPPASTPPLLLYETSDMCTPVLGGGSFQQRCEIRALLGPQVRREHDYNSLVVATYD